MVGTPGLAESRWERRAVRDHFPRAGCRTGVTGRKPWELDKRRPHSGSRRHLLSERTIGVAARRLQPASCRRFGRTSGDQRGMRRVVESRLPVVRVEETQRLVNFGKRSVFELQPGDLYYIEHVFEALDAPGEWYLDASSGTLFYLPMPGEQLERFEAVAPVLP